MLERIKNKLIDLAVTIWTTWSKVVEWATANSKSIIALLVLGNLFGITSPETATALRDALLGLMF